MEIIIVNDLKVGKWIPFVVFFILWEVLIVFSLIKWPIINSIYDSIKIILFILIPIILILIIFRNICKITYCEFENCINIYYYHKKLRIEIDLIKNLELRYGEDFDGDFGLQYYELIVLYDESNSIIFSYKSKEIEIPEQLLNNKKIGISYKNED